MEISKGMSIIDTKEYLALLEFQEAMQNEFVVFNFDSHHNRIFAYSKDKFLDKYEEGNKSISKRLESQNKEFYRICDQLHETELKLLDAETKLGKVETELAKASKFSLSSFLIGFLTLLATYSTIMLLTKYLKWY
jgi:hypothetical protein